MGDASSISALISKRTTYSGGGVDLSVDANR